MPLVLLLLSVALLGAGCIPSFPSPKIAEPYTSFPSASEAAYERGFGILPLPEDRRSSIPVELPENIPPFPETFSVLRINLGGPNETEARSVLSALRIPNGAIGPNPQTAGFVMAWSDGLGYSWAYDATAHTLNVRETVPPIRSLTVHDWGNPELFLDAGSAILAQLVLNSGMYGPPELAPNWKTWWEQEQQAGRCMTASHLGELRQADESSPYRTGLTPNLPAAFSTSCVNPEFPSEALIRFPGSADGQPVVRTNGATVTGAEIAIDTATLSLKRGRFFLQSNPDRSEYPSATLATLAERFAASAPPDSTGPIHIQKVTFSYVTRERNTTSGAREILLIPSYVAEASSPTHPNLILVAHLLQ